MVKLLTEIADEIKRPVYDKEKKEKYSPKYNINELEKLAEKYLSNCHTGCHSCVVGIG